MQLWLQLVALFLMLLSLPFISYGAVEEVAAIWWIGLLMIVAGGLIPPLLRYIPVGEGGNGGKAENAEDEKGD